MSPRALSSLAVRARDAGAAKSDSVLAFYISYDGVLEPLGESQAVAYVEGLAGFGRMILISFEKGSDLADRDAMQRMKARFAARAITWVPMRYHKKPTVLATTYDIIRGIVVGLLLIGSHRPGLVHARSYVAALIAWVLKRVSGVKFLFDMRGLWTNEKVDAGHWPPGSRIYRVAKRWERRFFESADGIVSLTEAGVAAFPSLGYRIPAGIPIEVIPTCTDLNKFVPGSKDPALAAKLGLDGHVVVGCTGNMSNTYLREPMLGCLAYLARSLNRLQILMVTLEDHDRLLADARSAGIPSSRLVVVRATFSDMPAYLRLMDFGLFFIKPCFSKKFSAATKLGEFLATGVPVVINDGIGDSGCLVRQEKVGVVLPGTDLGDVEAALDDIAALTRDPLIKQRCRETAKKYFDLDQGVTKYAALYGTLLSPKA